MAKFHEISRGVDRYILLSEDFKDVCTAPTQWGLGGYEVLSVEPALRLQLLHNIFLTLMF